MGPYTTTRVLLVKARTAIYGNLHDFFDETHQISYYYMLKIIWV